MEYVIFDLEYSQLDYKNKKLAKDLNIDILDLGQYFGHIFMKIF